MKLRFSVFFEEGHVKIDYHVRSIAGHLCLFLMETQVIYHKLHISEVSVSDQSFTI